MFFLGGENVDVFFGGGNVDVGKRMEVRADIESSGCRVAVALRSQASQNLSF